ncbi:GDP-L-galactose phosphorylase 1 [Melia azedarach]|uniref:GDP-L-galactose phosphorylase 1 n=2 Tax=Melia azedarach TaxID=155640 RepID=A0ACC1WVI1_MELAZ|nr:GDP-L-galactose phosphorylase 1 [Melia azedarach]KAJ4702977.1 GDP-L-galactose phosphorylase 1 [Melia azedarach]
MVTIKKLEHNKFLPKVATAEQIKCSFFSFQGINTPIYYLANQSLINDTPFVDLSVTLEEEQSLLDTLLLAQWEERMWKGGFRYDVTASEIKIINGRKKFLAQLNEKWSADPFIFNCVSHDEELLFCVASSEKANSELVPLAAVPNGAILIIINATPVEYGHVFLIPCGSDRLYMDAISFEMILRAAVEINNYSFRLFYDCSSPATSHPYFQACYFPDHLPVELMAIDTFFSGGQRGIHVSTVINYPIKTLLFEYTHNTKMAMEVISEICSYLREKHIPHNLLISGCGKKIFLFLQKLANSCNLSAWECSGYFLFQTKHEFDQVTEEAMLKCLSTVSLDDEGFQAVKQLCRRIASKLAI